MQYVDVQQTKRGRLRRNLFQQETEKEMFLDVIGSTTLAKLHRNCQKNSAEQCDNPQSES